MKNIISLDRLKIGQKGKIIRLDGGRAFQERAHSLGIRIGKKIIVSSSLPFRGPIAFKIDNIEIAVGRGMASKIIIEVL